MQNRHYAQEELEALEAAAFRAARAGRDEEATQYWNRILAVDPNHTRTLSALGKRSLRKGDMQSARTAFQRVADVQGSDARNWCHLALACRGLNDEQAEESAIQRALSIDPGDLVALILRADLVERQGKTHEAALAHGRVATVSPPLDQVRPELRAAVARALKYSEKYNQQYRAFLDAFLEPHIAQFGGDDLRRFRDSVDLVLGRKKRFDSHSLFYHYPGLLPVEFFDRAEVPWLDAIEAATDPIRKEFLALLSAEEGFVPYVSYAPGVPLDQWVELNNSPQWSAFHLYKAGKLIEENAAKCPNTMTALSAAPQPDQAGLTPSAMFSLLKPKTRIPPHTGVTNTRVVTHLPLIVPEGCGFRVGNDMRQWVPGRAWVFDDTIEHEAWNDSDKLRVVLIFDVWHPHLRPPERALITALAAGMAAFAGHPVGFEL